MASETGCGVETESNAASRLAYNGFLARILALCRHSEDSENVSRNYSGVYRYTMLGIWVGSSLVMILDRFFWNVWPRQSVCTDGCGTDIFCDMDVDPGCLQEGPWSVKVFDVIARISSRLIISTTTLLFGTMCHGTWNYLSEVDLLRPFLYGWRGDNFWLHTVGGWSIGIWVIAHVWSLLLPSAFHGFRNVKVPGQFGWLPPQVPIPGGNLNAADKEARWGVDDIWRIFWMTVIFGALMPLSRSAWAQRKNFSLAMILHTALGAGFFIDSVRRKTHPHVWILNTPVVIWYIADKIWCATRGRVNPFVKATRVVLDDEYMLLLWTNDDKPKRICDIFWLKQSHARFGKGTGRVGELAHPFTTCSSHDIVVRRVLRTSPSHGQHTLDPNTRPMIEVPSQTDVSWPGHRFSLNSAASIVSHTRASARGSTISGLNGGHGVRALTKPDLLGPRDRRSVLNETLAGADMGGGGGNEGGSGQIRAPDMGAGTDCEALKSGSSGIVSRHSVNSPAPGSELEFSPSPRGLELARSEQGNTLQEEEKFDRDGDEDTMISADSSCRPGEIALVIGSVRSCDLDTERSIMASSVKRFNSEGEGNLESLNEGGYGTRTETTTTGTQAASTSDASPWLPEDAIGQPLPRPQMGEPLPRVDTCESERIDPSKGTPQTGRVELTPRTKWSQWIEWARCAKWTKWIEWTGRSKCRVGHALEPPDCEEGGDFTDTSAATAEGAVGGKRAGLKRLETPLFQQYRNAVTKGVEGEGLGLECRLGRVPGQAWNKMAIVRIHRPKKEPKVRECTCMGITHVVSSFRRAETASIADCDTAKGGGSAPLRAYGPYRSDYGRLGEFPNLPPLLIIATGAGAALAIDFVAFVRTNQLVARRPVKVCYSSASLALLQFVTNTLLAESTPGIEIKTALTRHDDLEARVFDMATEPKKDLVIGRLDVKALVEGVSDDTEVYFCGGGTINVLLRETCARRNMVYKGSSVQ